MASRQHGIHAVDHKHSGTNGLCCMHCKTLQETASTLAQAAEIHCSHHRLGLWCRAGFRKSRLQLGRIGGGCFAHEVLANKGGGWALGAHTCTHHITATMCKCWMRTQLSHSISCTTLLAALACSLCMRPLLGNTLTYYQAVCNPNCSNICYLSSCSQAANLTVPLPVRLHTTQEPGQQL